MNNIVQYIGKQDFSFGALAAFWIGLIFCAAAALVSGLIGMSIIFHRTDVISDGNATLLQVNIDLVLWLFWGVVFFGFFLIPAGIVLGLLGLHSSRRKKAQIGLVFSFLSVFVYFFVIARLAMAMLD